MSDKIFIGWEEVIDGCDGLVRRCQQEPFSPEYIYGIPRGGMIPARIVQEMLSSAEEPSKPFLLFDLDSLSHALEEGYKVLVVDEIADTGRELTSLMNGLHQRGHGEDTLNEQLRIGVLHYIMHSKFEPDYYTLSFCNKKGWIVYPWEREALSLQD